MGGRRSRLRAAHPDPRRAVFHEGHVPPAQVGRLGAPEQRVPHDRGDGDIHVAPAPRGRFEFGAPGGTRARQPRRSADRLERRARQSPGLARLPASLVRGAVFQPRQRLPHPFRGRRIGQSGRSVIVTDRFSVHGERRHGQPRRGPVGQVGGHGERIGGQRLQPLVHGPGPELFPDRRVGPSRGRAAAVLQGIRNRRDMVFGQVGRRLQRRLLPVHPTTSHKHPRPPAASWPSIYVP